MSGDLHSNKRVGEAGFERPTASAATCRRFGIYPKTKKPTPHREIGFYLSRGGRIRTFLLLGFWGMNSALIFDEKRPLESLKVII